MVLAVLPMVELVEVAEGVLEPSDHLGTRPDRFLFKNRYLNMFQMFFFMNINIFIQKVSTKNFMKLAQKLLPFAFATPPVSMSRKHHSCPLPLSFIFGRYLSISHKLASSASLSMPMMVYRIGFKNYRYLY